MFAQRINEMTTEQAEELFRNGEISLSQKLSIKANNTEPRIVPTNQGFSIEYWTAHLNYAILGHSKLEEDHSNVEWTKKIFNGLISGDVKMIFGLSGINGVIALMEFIKLHFEDKYKVAVETLKQYAHNQNNQTLIDYANSLRK